MEGWKHFNGWEFSDNGENIILHYSYENFWSNTEYCTDFDSETVSLETILKLYKISEKNRINIMKQEDKDLLLKDLCARLAYGVKCQVQEDEYTYIGTLCRIEVDNKNGNLLDFVETISGLDCQVYLTEVKPYLFPIPSMTEEQREELMFISEVRITFTPDRIIEVYKNTIEWFLKNHIDYNNLIGKGLAIDATNLNIY